MNTTLGMDFEALAGEAAVLGVYSQVFAVLADQSGAMVHDPASIDIDEAILAAFADADAEGLTLEQVVAACRHHPEGSVRRRFDVLRSYRALERVSGRSHELHHRAAFAPFVMLQFLRRIGERGGQSELHQLLALEQLSVTHERATATDAKATMARLTTVFRLLAHQLTGLAVSGVVESLRENAQLLWGNHELLDQAHLVHETVLGRWPGLAGICQGLRLAVGAYRDAVGAAAGRLINQAGSTRALGLLPDETWITFARTADVEALAGVVSGFLFDAPAPWFNTATLVEAVEAAADVTEIRMTPPRSQIDPAPVDDRTKAQTDAAQLRATLERALSDRTRVGLIDLLDEIGDWRGARRLLAELTAAHHHEDLPFRLSWDAPLRIDRAAELSWMSQGWLTRTGDDPGDRP